MERLLWPLTEPTSTTLGISTQTQKQYSKIKYGKYIGKESN